MEELAQIVGTQNVETDPSIIASLSNDLFYWADAQPAVAVAAPSRAEQVSALVRWAERTRHCLVVRGGGMSFSAGYVPSRQRCVVVDLRSVNCVRRIDETDAFVEVECGATWEALQLELDKKGLTTVFEAPVSGNVSTIGGALSQGVTGDMAGLLGLEVVTGTGAVIRTGSWARRDHENPFFRQFGPDLTGLLCGDCGALGIKTAAVLALEPKPPAQAHASFAFAEFGHLLDAVALCGRSRQLSRCIGLDPKKSQNAPKVGFKKSIETLSAMVDSQSDGRLAEALRIARSGRNFMAGVRWSLHLSCDGGDGPTAQSKLEAAREACLVHGREIPNLLPMALAVRPFSVRGFLGPGGERWIPVNAVFPFSQAQDAAASLEAFFAQRRAGMDQLGVWESYLIRGHHGHVTIEPSVYWPDEMTQLHRMHLDERSARRFAKRSASLETRAFVVDLHAQLIRCLDEAGAAHVQIGRTHRYFDRVGEGMARILEGLKQTFDPHGILNPGCLGLEPVAGKG